MLCRVLKFMTIIGFSFVRVRDVVCEIRGAARATFHVPKAFGSQLDLCQLNYTVVGLNNLPKQSHSNTVEDPE
jgi:hypothetical protein